MNVQEDPKTHLICCFSDLSRTHLKVFMKSHQLSVNDEIFYISLIFGSILLVNFTSFSWALINTSALFMINMSNFLQKCLMLIRKMLVNMFNVVKNVREQCYWLFHHHCLEKMFF